MAANTAAGLENTAVTAEQNVQIQATADKMYAVAQAAEAANGPMARAARSAMDMNNNLQELAVDVVDDLARSISDVADGTKTAAEAFREMAASILRDLAQMIIKAAMWKAVSGFMGMGGATGITHTPGGFSAAFPMPIGPARAKGGPVWPGAAFPVGEKGPELFVPEMPGRIIPNGAMSSGPNISFAPAIDARGADEAAVARLERVIVRQQAEFESRVKAVVQNRPTKRW